MSYLRPIMVSRCIVVLPFVLVACGPTEPLLRLPPERLREVQPLDLARQARSIQTPEEARAAFLREPPPLLAPVDAPPEIELTLEECRALALTHNLDLAVQLISPTIARESITEEEARFEALFVGSIRYADRESPTLTTLEGSQVETLDTNLGVRVPLRTGGFVSFDLPTSRTETNNPFAILDPAYTANFSISLSQPLLRNAGVRVNTFAIRVAQIQTQISEARTKLEVIRIVAAVDRTYWRLYAARRELEVRKQEYDLAVAQLERAQRLVEAEILPEVEVIRAEAGVAERLEAIILAENALRNAERALKRLINRSDLGMETPTVVVPATQPDPVRYELDAIQLANAAVEQRMEMLELELQIALDADTIDVRRNQTLPLATLDYRYNVNALGASRGDAFDMLTDRDFDDHVIGLNVEIPLGNEAARSRLRQAIYSRVQRLATTDLRRQQIHQEVFNAVDQLEANWQRVLASRQAVILAARVLDAEQRQFEQGLRTSTDVLDAQARLANARSAEIRALTEYQIAQVDIAFATGTLLGATMVRWEPTVPAINQ